MIKLLVTGQNLALVQDKVVSGTHDYLEAEGTFYGPDWEGMYKWVHFIGGPYHYIIPMEHDRIEKEAHLDLTGGTWEVYIHGNTVEGDYVTERVTTCKQYLYVEGDQNGKPFPQLAPDLAELLANRVQRANDIADGVRNDADDGVFDGATYFPYVDEEGNISWTNDKGKENPEPQNIKGPKGDTGDSGVYIGHEEPTDPVKNVWIDPEGMVGKVIMSFELVSGNHMPGTYDRYLVVFSDGTELEIPVYNGAQGTGLGDMLQSVYDPSLKAQDIFAYTDNAVRPKANQTDLTAHINDKNNPHEVTAEQLNLHKVATSGDYNDLENLPEPSGFFVAQYGVTIFDEILTAFLANKVIYCKLGKIYYPMTSIDAEEKIAGFTGAVYGPPRTLVQNTCTEDGWSARYTALLQLDMIDKELNNTSMYPVQNKVIYAALEKKQDALTIDNAMSASSTNPVQNRAIKQYIDSKKVDFLLEDRVSNTQNFSGATIGRQYNASITFDIAKNGYTPICLATGGYMNGIGVGSGNMHTCLPNGGNAQSLGNQLATGWSYYATAESGSFTASIKVLYIKNGG